MKRRVYPNDSRARAARTLAVLAAGVLPLAAPFAQTEDADTLEDLKACAAIERGNARLACYDGVLGRPAGAPEPAAPTTTAVGPSTRAASGVAETIVVVELRLRTPSSAIFVTDRGQVWEQTGSGRGRYPEVPFEATLESGSLGSTFLVSPAGGPRIRVKQRE